ncbi:hypothetical protein BDP27DRAFT_1220309, partial [Rhodocollybia butyracea]
IDILYVHWWGWDTSVEEVMDSLHNIIASGKVIYLGIPQFGSSCRLINMQKTMGRCVFVVYQVWKWNIMDHSSKCDIIPIARSLSLALAPSPRINSVPTKKRNAAGKVERKDIPCMVGLGRYWGRSQGVSLLKRSCKRLERTSDYNFDYLSSLFR